ncbi:hypothetical protein HZA96_06820 [Candidatus Woesearchaeota archaeon]|nr:hypothetical protein [Candidatus Woesearchaeota archaeon]
MKKNKKSQSEHSSKQKNRFIIIIFLIIALLIIGFISENSGWSKGFSFVGQAYKGNMKQLKRINSPSCAETDANMIQQEEYVNGKITFLETVYTVDAAKKKKVAVTQTTTLTDACKDKTFLQEFSCKNYSSDVKGNADLYKVSSKLSSFIKCKYGCDTKKGACNTAASCNNKVKDGDEEDVDCGGKSCKACTSKQFCEDLDGLNYENKGFVTIEVDNAGKKEKMPIDDKCKDEKLLLEQACDVNGYVEKEYDCSAACVLGYSFKSINGNGGGGSLSVLFFVGEKKTIGDTEVTLESFTNPQICTFLFNDPEANIVSAKIIIPKAGPDGGGYEFNKGGNKITFTVNEAKQFPENRKCDGGKCIAFDVCKDIKELSSDSMTCIDQVLEPVEKQVEEKCPKDWKYYGCSGEKQMYLFYQCLLEKFPELKIDLQLCAKEIECYDSDNGKDIYVQGTTTNGTSPTVTDYCYSDIVVGENENLVIEFYCKDGKAMLSDIYCPAGEWCYDGICKQKPVCALIDCSALSKQPAEYLMGSNDWFYNQTANDVDPVISSSELSSLSSKENFVDNVGSNKNTVSYSQALLFGNYFSPKFVFAQDDNVAPKAGSYLFFSDMSNNYVWNYTINFDKPINFDQSSAEKMKEDLVGTTLKIMGKEYQIVFAKLKIPSFNDISKLDIASLTLMNGQIMQWMTDQDACFSAIVRDVDGQYKKHEIKVADVVITDVKNYCSLLVDGGVVNVDKGTTAVKNNLRIGVLDTKMLTSETGVVTKTCKVAISANSITLHNSYAIDYNHEEILLNGEKLSDVTGWYGTTQFYATYGSTKTTGKLGGINIGLRPDNDKLYLAEGNKVVDPLFGGFVIDFKDIVNKDKVEKIKLEAFGTAAKISLSIIDGTQLNLQLKAKDADSNVYWGDDVATVDGKIYLEGDACVGSTSIIDCKGAKFLISTGVGKVSRLIKITKLDTTDKVISFEDNTGNCKADNIKYLNNEMFTVTCTKGTSAFSFQLVINEPEKKITFKDLGEGYAEDSSYIDIATNLFGTMRLLNKNRGEINATNIKNAQFEGGEFYEHIDYALPQTSYLSLLNGQNGQKFTFNAVYDDVGDNVIEFTFDPYFPSNLVPLSGNQPVPPAYPFSKQAVSDIDDDNQVFVSAKGTEFWIDDDSSKQKIEIIHPKNTIYAEVAIVDQSSQFVCK